MRRIVSVWLPAWPIERLRRHRGHNHVPADRPLALVSSGAHGLEITAANEAARELRVRAGAGLADTRAALPALITLPADMGEDRAGLARLVRWCGRYGPARHLDGEDGLWIDITGVAHLFVRPAAWGTHASAREVGRESADASERALLDDLVGRFSRFGLTVRAGLADTLGSAHATARFATSSASPFVIVPPGDAQRALAALPVAALRLDADAIRLLERLGLRTIGQLYGLPRAALERRFRSLRSKGARTAAVAATVLRRLDQALGHHAEPRAPLVEASDFTARLPFSDPLVTATGIDAALDWLCRDLAGTLARAGVGGGRFRLTLYRTDGSSTGEVTIGTSAPCRDDVHMRRLLGEKITDFDAGFGIDLMTLEASGVERLDAHQQGLDGDADRARTAAGRLVDRLSGRLGSGRVLRLRPHASHIPEAAQKRIPAIRHGSAMAPEPHVRPLSFDGFPHRPPFLLDPPEPIAVLAAVPEGAPILITWRRVRRRIARSEGPERIAPAWWESFAPPVARSPAGAPIPGSTRDYYLVETATGARYWVFRAGLYIGEMAEDETTEGAEEDGLQDRAPRWFMHGLLS
jgi:protein ImuB